MNKRNEKLINKHIKCHIVKRENDIEPSELITSNELSTYKKMNYELKNVQNVLGILLKTILKFSNNRFYKNLYSKNCRIKKFPDTLFGCSWRKNKY